MSIGPVWAVHLVPPGAGSVARLLHRCDGGERALQARENLWRDSQAFGLGCRNGPYRPEIRVRVLGVLRLKSWTISCKEGEELLLRALQFEPVVPLNHGRHLEAKVAWIYMKTLLSDIQITQCSR
jgi:hypothetical protein